MWFDFEAPPTPAGFPIYLPPAPTGFEWCVEAVFGVENPGRDTLIEGYGCSDTDHDWQETPDPHGWPRSASTIVLHRDLDRPTILRVVGFLRRA